MTRDLVQPRGSKLLVPIVLVALIGGVSAGAQTTFEDLFEVAKSLNDNAVASQATIDELDDERSEMLADYKTTLKQTDGVKVYNRQLQVIVNRQLDKIATIKQSIEDVTGIQREITPLMLRMIEALDQFVQLDMPFDLEERVNRVERLRDMMDNPDVSVSEKFSQVLRAYQIESEYGRTIGPKTALIVIDGTERNVDVLRIGRIAMVYQTSDGRETGWWNPNTKEWERLNDSYTIPVRNGLKIARKQKSQGLIRVPIVISQGASGG